jgi:hypothetical protein
LAELLSRLRQSSYGHKANRGMQGNRFRIGSTHAGDHAVTLSNLALRDQLAQQQLADAVANAVGTDVDGIFHCEPIALPWANGEA